MSSSRRKPTIASSSSSLLKNSDSSNKKKIVQLNDAAESERFGNEDGDDQHAIHHHNERVAGLRPKSIKLHRRTASSSRATLPFLSSGGEETMATVAMKRTTSTASSSSSTKNNSDSPMKKARAQPLLDSTETTVSVRNMELKDINTVYELGNSIFTAAEFPNMYRTWDEYSVIENYEGSPEFCFVATTATAAADVAEEESEKKEDDDAAAAAGGSSGGGEIVGFLLGQVMSKIRVGHRGYIEWVAVVSDYRRRGVARRLLQAYTVAARERGITLLLADTPADNHPALQMFESTGLNVTTDHVYLTRQVPPVPAETRKLVDEATFLQHSYTVTNTRDGVKQKITIRHMEIADIHPVYLIGEQVFTEKSANLFNFWDESTALHSYLSDSEYCIVATVKDDDDQDTVVAFCFGTTIEKPRSSWKYGYLVWLGCATEYQGLGLASQLYNFMTALFAKTKCRIIMIDTQQNNQGALAFFRKKGFGHDEEHVYLSNAAVKMPTHTALVANTNSG